MLFYNPIIVLKISKVNKFISVFVIYITPIKLSESILI